MDMLAKIIQNLCIVATVSASAPTDKTLVTTASYTPSHPSLRHQTTRMTFSVTFAFVITMVVNVTRKQQVPQAGTPTEPRRQSNATTTYHLYLWTAPQQTLILYNGCMILLPCMTKRE